MSAGTKADSEGTLVRPNQVNDQVNVESLVHTTTRSTTPLHGPSLVRAHNTIVLYSDSVTLRMKML